MRVDDGRGDDDPLHLIVEIKGYRREHEKDKKAAMETYWVPGVNRLGAYGRWAFAEFADVYDMQFDFETRVEVEFNRLMNQFRPKEGVAAAEWSARAGGSAPGIEYVSRRRST